MNFNKPLLVLLFVAFFLTLSNGLRAQSIVFDKAVHDFGTLKEDGGPQKTRFVFTNKGKINLKVTNVQASCGCTTPDWTKEDVAPGKTGFVDAEYNPQGRPGAFDKSLTVTTNVPDQATMMLQIKGTVKEREKTIADLYPKKIGDFRLVSEYLNMGRVVPGKENVQTFKIYNEGDQTVDFSDVKVPQQHIKISVMPTKLKGKETGEIKVSYDATAKKDYGYTNDAFELPTKGGVAATIPLFVVGTIEDEPKKLTPEEAAKGPKLQIDTKEHDFGVLTPGEIVVYNFHFKNVGGQKLVLHKTKASCGCTASQPGKMELAPGDTSSIKVTFNSTGKHDGDQYQSVTIYSNDPAEPTLYVSIKCKVDSKKENKDILAAPKPMTSTEALMVKPTTTNNNAVATPVAPKAKSIKKKK